MQCPQVFHYCWAALAVFNLFSVLASALFSLKSAKSSFVRLCSFSLLSRVKLVSFTRKGEKPFLSFYLLHTKIVAWRSFFLSSSWTDATKGGMKSVACFFILSKEPKLWTKMGEQPATLAAESIFSHIPRNWQKNRASNDLKVWRLGGRTATPSSWYEVRLWLEPFFITILLLAVVVKQ